MSKRHSTDIGIDSICPCGSAQVYRGCCEPVHLGRSSAATPEALMRSRYSAFVLGLSGYLLASWHPSTRPVALNLDEPVKWLGLDILTKTGGASDEVGCVEFLARYKMGGKAYRLKESSRFIKEEGRWYYVDGDLDDE